MDYFRQLFEAVSEHCSHSGGGFEKDNGVGSARHSESPVQSTGDFLYPFLLALTEVGARMEGYGFHAESLGPLEFDGHGFDGLSVMCIICGGEIDEI